MGNEYDTDYILFLFWYSTSGLLTARVVALISLGVRLLIWTAASSYKRGLETVTCVWIALTVNPMYAVRPRIKRIYTTQYYLCLNYVKQIALCGARLMHQCLPTYYSRVLAAHWHLGLGSYSRFRPNVVEIPFNTHFFLSENGWPRVERRVFDKSLLAPSLKRAQ